MYKSTKILIALVAAALILPLILSRSQTRQNSSIVFEQAPLPQKETRSAGARRAAPAAPAPPPIALPAANTSGVQEIARYFAERRSGVSASAEGMVVKILQDDVDPPRHQRFLVELSNGQTLLFAHNIDLAPRVGNLREDTSISFSGVYEWNEKGGVVHWTHHDPDGQIAGGWLQYGGQTYR